MKKLTGTVLFLILSSFLYVTTLQALNLSRVKEWSAAEILTADDLNAEFDNVLDHEITNADIAAAAGIPASKLDLTVASPIGSTTPSTGAFTTLSTTGDTTLGNAATDIVNMVSNNLVFEGATANNYETTLTAADTDTSDKTITLPNTTGTVITTGDSGTVTNTMLAGSIDLTAKVTGTLPVGNGGTGATVAANAANGVVVLGADGYLPNSSCDTTALKTTSGEVSTTGGANLVLPGGVYGFYPQVKTSVGTNHVDACLAGIRGVLTGITSTSYITSISLYNDGAGTAYATQTYVTASGQDMWIFLLIDKSTKEIISVYQAPDHPAYGNGGDFNKVPHPFLNYDATKQDIVLLDKETCTALKQESQETDESILTLLNENYKVNIKDQKYVPLHSGKFINQKPELVQTIPSYIKVRKLTKLIEEEVEVREVKRRQKQAECEQEKIKKEQSKLSAKNKLKMLGLTDDEIEEISN